jgi:hypothetical protein
MPSGAFAQRGGAGAHAGMGHPIGGGRPAVHVPQAPITRPMTGAGARPIIPSPVTTRPIFTRPTGVGPIVPFRAPLTSSGMFLPTRPPRRFPPALGIAGYPGSAAYFGYNPFLFGGCGGFGGFGYGCGILPPFYGYGIGYGPTTAYPIDPVYPSGPVYPSEPVYSPPDPLATLQYTPLLNPYPSLDSSSPEDSTAASGANVGMRNETLLYLKEGSVFAVASYTVSGGRLHYLTAYGDRNDVAVDQIDLRKTIEANAARGVAFTLTPAPNAAPAVSAPAPLGPAPAPEGPITPPKL